MNEQELPSKLLEAAINQLAQLPGIGRKTALRLALFLLKKEISEVNQLGDSIINLRKNVQYCKICRNISDSEICNICSNSSRNRDIICVVETIKDVMAIENTALYNGVYHVLGGIISPMDGIGPNDLEIESLVERANDGEVTEIVLALSTTMEGDTTNYYIYKKISSSNIKISTIARGVSIGEELEYTDEVTLGRSIVNRTEFEV